MHYDEAVKAYEAWIDDTEKIAKTETVIVERSRLIAAVPFGVGRPVWVDDTHFNLEYHVRHTALPAPGNRDKLEALDGNRPFTEIGNSTIR